MIRAVLFDRDGTLIADDLAKPELMPGATAAVGRLRARGMLIGVVTNQPRAAADMGAVRAMEALHCRIEERIGRLDGWFVCTHPVHAGCECRKPQPGLVFQAARAFGVTPAQCVVIGDIGSDVEAAHRAGAHAILVPTPITRREEIERAPIVCRTLTDAAAHVERMAA